MEKKEGRKKQHKSYKLLAGSLAPVKCGQRVWKAPTEISRFLALKHMDGDRRSSLFKKKKERKKEKKGANITPESQHLEDTGRWISLRSRLAFSKYRTPGHAELSRKPCT